jgi:hypothetical protein
MRRTTALVVATGLALALGACSSSSKTGAQDTGPAGSAAAGATQAAQTPTQAAPPTTAPSSASSSAAAPSPVAASVSAIGTTVATNLDPCQLVTSAEASALAGTTYGAGKEEPSGNTKECVYGYQTTNVFTIEVTQADSVATAQAAWTAAKAQADAGLKQQLPPGVTVNINTAGIPGIGDQAATVYASDNLGGQQFGISGIYVLKGATFFAFQDLLVGHAPPTVAAMEAEAMTVLGRI